MILNLLASCKLDTKKAKYIDPYVIENINGGIAQW